MVSLLRRVVVNLARRRVVSLVRRKVVNLTVFCNMEFGILKGRVKSLSLVPVAGGYIADIELLNGMKTTYNREIGFIQEMNGTAEIITEESRLIYKFINPLKALVTK